VKVAYLVSLYPAPSHTFIRREIAALRRRGVDLDIFSVRPPQAGEVMSEVDRADRDETTYLLPAGPLAVLGNNLRMFLRAPGAYLGALALSLRHRNPGARELLYAFFYFIEGMLLAEHLHRRGVEHLHNHFANAAAHVALVATRYLGIRLSLTLHGTCDFEYPAGPLLGDKIRHSDFVACVSQYGVAQAMRVVPPAQWGKLCVVRCGVELEKLPRRQPRDAEGTAGPLRIICVGRLSPEKGHLGLVDAFALARRRGLDAELVLVGAGPEQAAVEARIVAAGVQPHVKLLGQLPEARTLEETARSDILVLASFMEGLPVVLMEAMAMGVPVIAPTVAGIPELVEHGASGQLFIAGDWDQLAERMCTLGADPTLRAGLAAAARRRIEEQFDVARAVAPLAERLAGHPARTVAPPLAAHAPQPPATAR
jgi:glycosyltransferase involved in cell wall biosynthesis